MENNIFAKFQAKQVSFDKSVKSMKEELKIARFKREFRCVSRDLLPDFDAEVGVKKPKKEGGFYAEWSQYEMKKPSEF